MGMLYMASLGIVGECASGRPDERGPLIRKLSYVCTILPFKRCRVTCVLALQDIRKHKASTSTLDIYIYTYVYNICIYIHIQVYVFYYIFKVTQI